MAIDIFQKFFPQIPQESLTSFSKLIGIITEPTYLFVIALAISATLFFKKQKSQAILLASTSIITAIIIKTLKAIIAAPRPAAMQVLETGYSFPSGHTTFAVIFFGLLTYIFIKQKYKITSIVASTLIIITIALTRLQLQVHWLIDIIGGLIIGSIILFLSIIIHKNSTKNIKNNTFIKNL